MLKMLQNVARLVLCILLVIGLSGCKRGKETLPELSNAIAKGLTSGSFSKLQELMPTKEEVTKYYDLYQKEYYDSDAMRNSAAIKFSEEMQTKLKANFEEFGRTSRINGFEPKTAKMTDYKYEIEPRREGQELGILKLFLANGDKVRVVSCNAFSIEGRWFLVDGLEASAP